MSGGRPDLVRAFVLTNGRARPSRGILDAVDTLVEAHHEATAAGAGPERRAALALCSQGALSLIEVAAHLDLPVTVTRILLTDLVDSGDLRVIPMAQLPDRKKLEDILDGLRRLQV